MSNILTNRREFVLGTGAAIAFVAAVPSASALASGPATSPMAVPTKGEASKVQFEEVVSGHLTDLNGKYKLRVTQLQFDPGGSIGDHQHRGPGIRLITVGELTIVQEGKSIVYKAGDYWYESGDVTNSAANNGAAPATVLNFEILPADLKGGSGFVPG